MATVSHTDRLMAWRSGVPLTRGVCTSTVPDRTVRTAHHPCCAAVKSHSMQGMHVSQAQPLDNLYQHLNLPACSCRAISPTCPSLLLLCSLLDPHDNGIIMLGVLHDEGKLGQARGDHSVPSLSVVILIGQEVASCSTCDDTWCARIQGG